MENYSNSIVIFDAPKYAGKYSVKDFQIKTEWDFVLYYSAVVLLVAPPVGFWLISNTFTS